MSSQYKRHSFELLKTLYPRLSVRAIERTFKAEYEFRFTDAFNALHAISATIPIDTKSENDNVRARILIEAPFLENINQIVLKHKRLSSNRLPRKERLDHVLLQEMAHIPQLNEEGKENLLPPSHQGRPKEPEADDEETLNNGETVVCGCCMDSILKTEMVRCGDEFSIIQSSRHYFCKTCLKGYFNEQFHGKNQSDLRCMSIEECANTFGLDQLGLVLSPRTKTNYDIRLAQEAIKEAGIDLW